MKGERVKRWGKRVMNWSKYKTICSSCSKITNYSGDKNAIDEYFEPLWWRQELLKLLSILPLLSIILKVGSMRTKVLSERSFSHINFFLLFTILMKMTTTTFLQPTTCSVTPLTFSFFGFQISCSLTPSCIVASASPYFTFASKPFLIFDF